MTRAPEPHRLSMLSAGEVAAGFAAGELSPLEVTEAALAAIETFDPEVGAMVLVDAERAIAEARASQLRWRRGEQRSVVDGVPVTIKDMFLTRGWPMLRGSTLTDPAGPWESDAPAVARLRESGAVLLGKNATPEFAWKGVTDSILHGSTGNPWGSELTSGGSSGGAATAVGLGMGSWSIGSDGGGSVRIPAAFTGTVALKPTYGLVPAYPPSPYGTLSHVGPMTRSVTDAALLMDVLTGFDSRDWFATRRPSRSFLDGLDDGVAGLRVAYSPTLSGTGDNAPQVRAAVDAAVEVLSGLGATVELLDPAPAVLAAVREAFHVLWFTAAAKVLEPFGRGALERIDPLLAEHVREHREDSASAYLDAVQVRMDLGVAMGALHDDFDVLVTPTMPIPAFERGQNAPTGWPEQLWTSWTPYTYPFNLTGQPALTVPCGLTDDERPIGLQIIGPRHADPLVLRVGRAFEAATDSQRVLPLLLR